MRKFDFLGKFLICTFLSKKDPKGLSNETEKSWCFFLLEIDITDYMISSASLMIRKIVAVSCSHPLKLYVLVIRNMIRRN